MHIFLVALVLLTPISVSSDQFNDLYYVAPVDVPDLTEEGEESEQPPSGGAGSTGAGSNSSGGESSSSEPPAGADGDNNSGSGVESGEEALEELLGSGALQGDGLLGSGEEDELTDDEGAAADGGWGGSFSLDGKKVRAAARSDSDISAVLRYWKLGGSKMGSGKTGRMSPAQYYALVASTLASEDEQLESASFSAGKFEIVYRSRGALFWFIPMSFPVRLTVAIRTESTDVQVRLPWYRLFVNEYFKPADLAEAVRGTVISTLTQNTNPETAQPEVFDAVVRLLRERSQTVQNSIFLK